MSRYSVRYVHRVAPRDTDTMPEVDLPDGAFSNRATLARALREARVLQPGDRVRTFRVDGDKLVVFPDRGIWHSVILTSEGTS